MSAAAVRGAALRLCCCLVVAGACATAGGNSATRRSSNNNAQITLEEIENAHQPTLFDVVRALRPMWLRVASTSITNDQTSAIAVYVDEQHAGGLDVLRQLPSTAALEIRFYGTTEAQSRFGIDYMHGVIQVVSPRGSREH